MALLSDRHSFDSLAGIRAKAAIQSEKDHEAGQTWTLLEACQAAKLVYPVNENELKTVFRSLDTYGIIHNMIGEPIWFQLMGWQNLNDWITFASIVNKD